MFLSLIVTILERLGLALLGTFFHSTATTAQDAGIDPTALQYLYDLVDSAAKNTLLDTPDKEYQWIFNQAVTYFTSRGMDLAITMLDSLVVLATHHYNTSNARQAPTIHSLAASAAS